jgi:hypothetical protein
VVLPTPPFWLAIAKSCGAVGTDSEDDGVKVGHAGDGLVGNVPVLFAGALLGVVLHLLQSMRRTQDLLRFDRLQLIMSSIARPAMVLLPAAALLVANRLAPASSAMAPLLSGLCIVATAMVAWRFVLDAGERQEVIHFASTRMRRLTA